MPLIAGETYRLEVETFFDAHRLGSNLGVRSGQIKIERGSDGMWWNGSAFQAVEQFVAATVLGGTIDPIYYYDFLVPVAAAPGEVFNFLMRANADGAAEKRFTGQVGTVSGGGISPIFVFDD